MEAKLTVSSFVLKRTALRQIRALRWTGEYSDVLQAYIRLSQSGILCHLKDNELIVFESGHRKVDHNITLYKLETYYPFSESDSEQNLCHYAEIFKNVLKESLIHVQSVIGMNNTNGETNFEINVHESLLLCMMLEVCTLNIFYDKSIGVIITIMRSIESTCDKKVETYEHISDKTKIRKRKEVNKDAQLNSYFKNHKISLENFDHSCTENFNSDSIMQSRNINWKETIQRERESMVGLQEQPEHQGSRAFIPNKRDRKETQESILDSHKSEEYSPIGNNFDWLSCSTILSERIVSFEMNCFLNECARYSKGDGCGAFLENSSIRPCCTKMSEKIRYFIISKFCQYLQNLFGLENVGGPCSLLDLSKFANNPYKSEIEHYNLSKRLSLLTLYKTKLLAVEVPHIQFWEQNCFSPISSSKNVEFFAISDCQSIQSSKRYIHNLSSMYNICNLGKHRQGVFPQSTTTCSNRPLRIDSETGIAIIADKQETVEALQRVLTHLCTCILKERVLESNTLHHNSLVREERIVNKVIYVMCDLPSDFIKSFIPNFLREGFNVREYGDVCSERQIIVLREFPKGFNIVIIPPKIYRSKSDQCSIRRAAFYIYSILETEVRIDHNHTNPKTEILHVYRKPSAFVINTFKSVQFHKKKKKEAQDMTLANGEISVYMSRTVHACYTICKHGTYNFCIVSICDEQGGSNQILVNRFSDDCFGNFSYLKWMIVEAGKILDVMTSKERNVDAGVEHLIALCKYGDVTDLELKEWNSTIKISHMNDTILFCSIEKESLLIVESTYGDAGFALMIPSEKHSIRIVAHCPIPEEMKEEHIECIPFIINLCGHKERKTDSEAIIGTTKRAVDELVNLSLLSFLRRSLIGGGLETVQFSWPIHVHDLGTYRISNPPCIIHHQEMFAIVVLTFVLFCLQCLLKVSTLPLFRNL